MSTASIRRTAYRTILGGVSILTGYGALQQFTKYTQQNQNWIQVQKQIQEFNPISIEGKDAVVYPWQQNASVKDWEYKIIKIKGWFKEERHLVRRSRDGKDGYLVFAPFVTSSRKVESDHNSTINTPNDSVVFVNLGWVPSENKDDIEMSGEPVPLLEANEDETLRDYDPNTGFVVDPEALVEEDALQITEITALVRRGEQQDILNGRRNWQNDAVFQYIDLDFMARFFRVFNLDGARSAYLERIVPSYEEEEEEMYPVPSSKDNFEQPLVNPQKYLQNSFLFGSTSALAMISVLSFFKR